MRAGVSHRIVLVKNIGRDREDAALLPLKSPLLAVLVPHGGRALAIDDHYGFVENLAAWRGLFAAGDFQDHGIVDHRVR